jgi:hypothetical protein
MRIGIDDPRLSRAERRRRERQMKKLEARAARVLEADRLYFERFPQRNHRVRLAAAVEIEGLRIASGDPLAIPPGYRVFMVVRQIAPGLHMWRFVLNHADAAAEIDVVSEELAAKIWEKEALKAELH